MNWSGWRALCAMRGKICPRRSRSSRNSSGSARVSRAGFGVPPKQSLLNAVHVNQVKKQRKVRDREDAIADTRDARSTPFLN